MRSGGEMRAQFTGGVSLDEIDIPRQCVFLDSWNCVIWVHFTEVINQSLGTGLHIVDDDKLSLLEEYRVFLHKGWQSHFYIFEILCLREDNDNHSPWCNMSTWLRLRWIHFEADHRLFWLHLFALGVLTLCAFHLLYNFSFQIYH